MVVLTITEVDGATRCNQETGGVVVAAIDDDKYHFKDSDDCDHN